MERITGKLWVLGILMLVLAGLVVAAPDQNKGAWTEANVETMHPIKVGNYIATLEPGKQYSYKMDKSSYDILKPAGMVARVFRDGGFEYDVVTIGSRNKESFHNPQVCMAAQGWTLGNERREMLKTSVGEVPVTLVDMDKAGTRTTALYFVKTRQGYFSDLSTVKLKMFWYKLKNFKSDDGVFVRIIPTTNTEVANLKKFTVQWIEAAIKTSKNFY